MNETRHKVLGSVEIATIADKVKTQDLSELRLINIAMWGGELKIVTGTNLRIV